MLTTELIITIPGEAIPKGSLKCVGRNGHHQLIEDNKRTKDWRATLVLWIKRKWPAHADRGQALGAEITFTLKRPASHYGTGRNAYLAKPSAPAHPVSHRAGDLDKLIRLVLDAIQDTDVLPDDSAVVEIQARKAYALDVSLPWGDVLGYPGVVIRLYPIGD